MDNLAIFTRCLLGIFVIIGSLFGIVINIIGLKFNLENQHNKDDNVVKEKKDK